MMARSPDSRKAPLVVLSSNRRQPAHGGPTARFAISAAAHRLFVACAISFGYGDKPFRQRAFLLHRFQGRSPAVRQQDQVRLQPNHKGELEMLQRLKIALAAIGMLVSASAGAQDYPTKPVTLIVPWPAGGSTDIAMRAIADSASKALGQPIVIDNKAGGSGTVGPATMAAAAKPDGYTIAQLPITVFRLPLMQEVSWDPARDFSYIIHLTGYTFGVTTNAETPFKKWQDVVDYAKQNPGKVTYATPGTGTSLHIGMEQIAAMAGIKLTQVPFKGGAETNAAVLGQHTTLQADSTGWRPLVDAGKLRLLMVWTSARSPNFPDAPT
jgi:tripartite-type tricarboxylate transporter receptor subunit TctC